MTREEFEKFIYGAYGVKADYPWLDKPNFGVFRHVIGRKWFALVMDLTMDKFGGDKNENEDVVNLKCVPSLIDSFCLDKGVYRAYHMNKANWISVVLSLADEEEIKMLVDMSYSLTMPKIKKIKKRIGTKSKNEKTRNNKSHIGKIMKTTYVSKSPKGIELYELENDNGVKAQIITYGARIAKLFVPNKNGEMIDVVAGFDTPDGFLGENPYFNAVIGRVGNRIGGATFTLGGKKYDLFKNDGNNHLHGGKCGFDSRIWNATILDGASLKLERVSQDGEEGYPGNLKVSVKYTLTNENSLVLEYEATCDKDTICSLTNHAYFNLDGDFESVLEHEVIIDANYLTAVDDELIPHGELKDVRETAFDFTKEKKIGKDIKADEHMLKIARGYDFNYVLNGKGFRKVASARSEKSGVKMDVFTDRACMQFYTGNFLEGIVGKKVYDYQSAFCMETQGYPNACNVPSFESMTLEKDKKYQAKTEYKFSVEK